MRRSLWDTRYNMIYAGQGYNIQLDSIDYILRIRRHLGLDKFWILGHSMGAGLGSLYAATFPEHVQVRLARWRMLKNIN